MLMNECMRNNVAKLPSSNFSTYISHIDKMLSFQINKKTCVNCQMKNFCNEFFFLIWNDEVEEKKNEFRPAS